MISISLVSIMVLALYWIGCCFSREKSIRLSLFVTLMFLPKLNLASVRGLSTAGVRIDDLLIIVLIVSLISSPSAHDGFWATSIKRFAPLILVNFISFLFGAIVFGNTMVLYSILVILRHAEYFSLILIGYSVVINDRAKAKLIDREMTKLFVMYAFVAVLQMAGLCNYMRSGSETGVWAGIPVSTFNGYYEYGMYLCLMAVYYFYQVLRGTGVKTHLLLMVALVLSYLTGSRTGFGVMLIVLTCVVLSRFFKVGMPRYLVAIVVAGLTLGTIFVIFLLTGSANYSLGRFGAEGIGSEISKFFYSMQHGDFFGYRQSIISGEEATFNRSLSTASSGDLSTTIRFRKWGSVFDGFLHYPLFGYGYGITQVVDGNYLRLLGETGIVGLFVWMYIYVGYMHRVRDLKNEFAKTAYMMMVAVALGAVFIDMFDASRIMEYLWFFVGITIALSNTKSVGIERISNVDFIVDQRSRKNKCMAALHMAKPCYRERPFL